jgi:hypothetical protein
VLLRELEGERRVLPIFIGGPEATAIAFALDEVATPRPMTHDLMKDLLEELGSSVERIVITGLRDGTFYAGIHLVANGDQHEVSARPSDAIALAVRTESPIYADEGVLDEAAYALDEEEGEEEEQEQVVEEFKEFIDSVSPDDFAS